MLKGNQLTKPCSSKSSFYKKLLFFASTPIPASNARNSSGFSLLELITALAVLSIVTTVSLVGIDGRGGILNWATRGKSDEAKALLNAAAADCLQKNRLNDENKDQIDPEIISNDKLSTLGFSIDDDANKCSYFQISPTNEDDSIRFPIGFSVSNGKLSKFATPTSTDSSSLASCKRWAGINCKEDESLKKWIPILNAVQEAKRTCTANYEAWLSNPDPIKPDGRFNKWNSNADSNCPSRPPAVLDFTPTCTTNGCNSPVVACQGKVVGTTQADYDKCIEEIYGGLCRDWVQQRIKTDNARDTAATYEYCGSTQFWFCDSKQWSSKDEMNGCLIEKENAKCIREKEERFSAKVEGKFSPSGTTLECQDVWYCFKDNGQSGNPYKSETTYKSECKNNEPPPPATPPCTPTQRFYGLC